MSNFQDALNQLLKDEGGYTNNPNDKGGPTNYGITQHDLSVFLGHAATIAEVKNMPVSVAAEIYKKHYWDLLNLDLVHSAMLASVLFNQAVLNGTATAARLMQEALGILADGQFGPKSVQALNAAKDPRALGIKFTQQLHLRYLAIVSSNKSQKIFYNGWMNRLHRLQNFIMHFDEKAVA